MNSIIKTLTDKIRTIAIACVVMTTTVAVCVTDVYAAPKKQSQFTVVVDAGHGGHDHGAIDNGTREKDINLGVATKLAAMLKKKMKNVKVVMTRDDDTFISLQERANIANKNKGDLFISIHTNSVDKSNPNRKKVAGATVYALGPQKDANNLKVAQRENAVIELEDNYHQKYSGFDPSKDESYIIFEMAQKKNLGQSLKFANKAQKELVKTAGRSDRGVKQAGFWVLWATSMPAVLVELDFICNPSEAKFLSSDSGQEKLAAALYNAVKDYIQSTDKKIARHDANESSEVRLEEMTASEINVDTDNSSAENPQGVGILLASTETKRVERNPHVATQTKKTYGPRKRRSSASRQVSNERNVETENIRLKDETDYLVKQEQAPQEAKPAVQQEEKTQGKGKNKKQKSKKVKKADAKKPAKENKKEKSRDSKHGNSKTFVVKSPAKSDVYTDFRNKQQAKNEKGSEVKTTRASVNNTPKEMVYKILLVTSDKELYAGDPAFAGLTPSGMYIENNTYKYTYGSSKSRQEIENKLLEVKSLLPDAVIVVRTE